MFSGIVESIGVVELIQTSINTKLGIRVELDTFKIIIGASIAINGCCLTVISKQDQILYFDAIPETLKCTNLGQLKISDSVNLEQSLLVGSRIDGHFVSGHIDETSRVIKIDDLEEWKSIYFELPSNLREFVAKKGSIAINGVSLTVGEVEPDRFCVYIIPHTAKVTNLGSLRVGDLVNLEADIIARYVVNSQKAKQ